MVLTRRGAGFPIDSPSISPITPALVHIPATITHSSSRRSLQLTNPTMANISLLDFAMANSSNMPAFTGKRKDYIPWKSDALSQLELSGCYDVANGTLDVNAGTDDEKAAAKEQSTTAFNLINRCISNDDPLSRLRAKQVVDSVTRGDGVALLEALDLEYVDNTDESMELLQDKFDDLKLSGNNVRKYFTEARQIETSLLAAGGAISQHDKIRAVKRAFSANIEWKARFVNLRSNCRVSSIPFTYAFVKRELIALAKGFEEDDAPTAQLNAITLNTNSSEWWYCGACKNRDGKTDYGHTGIWDPICPHNDPNFVKPTDGGKGGKSGKGSGKGTGKGGKGGGKGQASTTKPPPPSTADAPQGW